MNWNIFSLDYAILCTWTFTSLKVTFWWRCSTAFTARPEHWRDEPKVWQGHGAGQVQAAGPGLRRQGGGGERGCWGGGGGGGGGTGEMAGRQELLGAAGRWTQAADGASFGILFGHDAAAATSFIIQVHWGELNTRHFKKPDHLHACIIYQQCHIRELQCCRQTCFRVLLQESRSPSTVVKV